MRMTGCELQASTRGRWRGAPPREVFGLNTDTRLLKKGEVFLALRGPRFDGHRFAVEAVRRGALALIGDETGSASWRNMEPPCLQVNDTLRAFGDIAAAWREKLNATVIALTGSYGKTTVRSMLEHGLRRLGLNVAATRANDNNLIGVPQTLLGVGEDADVALVECGISETGEMQRLAHMVRPDIGMVTGLATAHAEGLGGLKGVAREKTTLLSHMTRDGYAVMGSGVSAILREQGISPAYRCLDMDAADDSVVRWRMHDARVLLTLGGESAAVEMELPALHQAADMALAATVAWRLTGKDIATLAGAFTGWRAMPGRMQRLTGRCGSVIIHDAYNANPASMAAALDTLRRMPGRHFAVLGDMAELGDESGRLHAGLNVSGLDGLILAGPRMRTLADMRAQACWAPDAGAAVAFVEKFNLAAGDVVLIKGSHCMEMERVVAALAASQDETRREKADAV